MNSDHSFLLNVEYIQKALHESVQILLQTEFEQDFIGLFLLETILTFIQYSSKFWYLTYL